jgi:glycosyltransferase involved in cell wall biosynthesis
MNQRCVALLGRRDQPTDAVEEYCRYLGNSLQARGIQLDIMRISWGECGWSKALRDFQKGIAPLQVAWFLLQYTALAWSRRGFSGRFLRVLRLLKKDGARCAVVFHDVEAYYGNRFIDRLRRAVQLRTMRQALRLADLSIFTVPLQKITWLRDAPQNAVFIPVGANLPSPERAWKKPETPSPGIPTIGIFSVAGGSIDAEARLIAETAAFVSAQVGPLRIQLFGRNSPLAEQSLRAALHGKPVDLIVRGILPPDEIVQLLGSCDVLFFQRGPVSSRRGSAIAGIACGLPVVACEGSETAPPITDAGVVLLPAGATREFGSALLRVLTDSAYRAQLAERSRQAQINHFCWKAIATRYAQALAQPLPHSQELAKSGSQNPH